MADAPEIGTDAAPSSLPPSEAELEAWNKLSRSDQVQRYRDYLAHAHCNSFTDEGPDEILAAARAKVAAQKRA